MQPYQKQAFDKFCTQYDVSGKTVLEVGSDYWTPGQKVVEAFREKEASLVVGITNEYRPDRLAKHRNKKNCYVFCADVCLAPLEDGLFDVVYMNDVIEHMQDVKGLFNEAFRVLKPGGVFFSASGPLWEGGTGHHLIFKRDGKNYSLTDAIIPPFFHHRLDKEKMKKFLEKEGRAKAEHIDFIADWVYESRALNRCYIKDFLREIKYSGFELSDMWINRSDGRAYDLLKYCPRFIVKRFFRKKSCTLKMDFMLKKPDK